MKVETERKGKRLEFLENKIKRPDSEVIEVMNKPGLHNLPSKRKSDRIKDRLNISSNNQNNLKETTELKLLKDSFVLIMNNL